MSLQQVTPASHVLYDNEVLESKLDDLLETKLNAINLMTVDNTLAQAPGMKKVVNKYTYEGQMERLAAGKGNETSGIVSFEAEEYPVAVAQQRFQYQDEQVMQDPMVLEVGLKGMAAQIVNDLNTQFFAEAAKANIEVTSAGANIAYADVVDAIAELQGASVANEDEAGLFLLIAPDVKAGIRKDSDFIHAHQGEILFDGQIGSIAGMPVIVSRKVPAGTAYVMTKEAITCFIKKDSEVEQERNANTRTNWIYGRRVYVVALTDATKIAKITKKA